MMVIERIGYRYPAWKVVVRVNFLDMAVRLSLWLRHGGRWLKVDAESGRFNYEIIKFNFGLQIENLKYYVSILFKSI